MRFTYFFAMLSTFLLASCGQSIGQSDKPLEGLTSSGYPYVIVRDKEGKEAEAGDRIRFHITVMHNGKQLAYEDFTGLLPDMTQLAKPKPETELLYLLSPGDSAIVYLLGEHLRMIDLQGLQPEDTISYHIGYVELVHSRADFEALTRKKEELNEFMRYAINARAAGTLGDSLIRFDSGLDLVLHRHQDGETPWPGSEVHVHFVGALSNGTVFTDTYRLGKPFKFNISMGEVMQGWDETIAHLSRGSTVTIFIPSNMAYGEEGVPGAVPPNEDLIYTMEIIKIVDNPDAQLPGF